LKNDIAKRYLNYNDENIRNNNELTNNSNFKNPSIIFAKSIIKSYAKKDITNQCLEKYYAFLQSIFNKLTIH